MGRLGAENARRRELETVGAQIDHRFIAEKGAGAAGILRQLVALDAYRKLALDRLDRRVHHIDDQLIHSADAVAVGPRAGAAAQDFILRIPAARLRMPPGAGDRAAGGTRPGTARANARIATEVVT